MHGTYKASTLTKEGAKALALKINAFWRKLNLQADAGIETQESEVDGTNSVRVVRSPMINGLPRAEYLRRLEIRKRGGMFGLAPLNLDVIPRPGTIRL